MISKELTKLIFIDWGNHNVLIFLPFPSDVIERHIAHALLLLLSIDKFTNLKPLDDKGQWDRNVIDYRLLKLLVPAGKLRSLSGLAFAPGSGTVFPDDLDQSPPKKILFTVILITVSRAEVCIRA